MRHEFHFRDMRFFVHADPQHRIKSARRHTTVKDRPSEAAIGVVGISPDFHAFAFDTWHKDADLIKSPLLMAADTERGRQGVEHLPAAWIPHYLTN